MGCYRLVTNVQMFAMLISACLKALPYMEQNQEQRNLLSFYYQEYYHLIDLVALHNLDEGKRSRFTK